MVKLAPSILSADFSRLGADCAGVLEAGADWLHIDVMDGHFVPNITLGMPVLAGLAKAVPAFYDVHLMISHPLRYAESFARAGADLISFHLEAEDPVEQTVAAIRAAGCGAALAIKPATRPEDVFPYLPLLDMVLVMSVEPGFGGQKFMPEAADKLRALRAEAVRIGKPALLLEVDGGINLETAPVCARAGVDVLVAGSAVFGAKAPAAAVSALRAACETGTRR